ncbi:MAG TPA: CocE/NonD family hydrolase [Thermoleophilaceae bacterium]|nr:CocE/NonD family hydrolase [Thermoleophilaceae bacterium]
MHLGRRAATVLACAVAAAATAPAGAAAAPPAPFGHACEPRNGVLFCPTRTLADRVPSFDGTPLDVDVTLPADAEAGRPLPTIAMLHGWGQDKSTFESDSPEGGSSTTYHYNNTWYAQRGYAVVNATARGFGRSCGKAEASAATPDCLARKSYVHLADQRWEARDVQHLLGLLADQRVSDPAALGVTGISYGGGQSIELAYLRDRIRREDNSFAAWRSPAGRSMAIRAAYPRWPWSDLVESLTPNGREGDDPLGIMKESWVTALLGAGAATGTYCGTPPRPPVCTDPSADLPRWYTRIQAGEPYGADARAIADEIRSFHQGYGIGGRTPAPMLLQSGWTDDLFPPKESIRAYQDSRSRGGWAALQLGDLGHFRGSNKENADRRFNDDGSAFFDRWLRGGEGGPAAGQVTAFTQTCPRPAPAGGPFEASSYASLAQGAVAFGSRLPQVVASVGGNPLTGVAFDPVGGGGDACRETAEETAPGTAVVVGPESRGYTLLGLPTVTAHISTTGRFGQLDSRLWDVSPDGRQRLISRSAYRLRDNQSGRIVLQLHGNGWCFAPGHRPKLELLGKDEPFLRPSNGAFAVRVSEVGVALPTAERRQGGCSK